MLAPRCKIFRATPLIHIVRKHRDGDRLIQLKIQLRFRRDFHGLAAGRALVDSSRSAADSRSNRRALAAAGDSSDQRSQNRSTANFFRGVFTARFA